MQSVMPRLPMPPASLRRRAKLSPLDLGHALIDCHLLAPPMLALICKRLALLAITSIWQELVSRLLAYHQCFLFPRLPLPCDAAACEGAMHNNRIQRSAGSEFRMLQSMPFPRPLMRAVRPLLARRYELTPHPDGTNILLEKFN